MQLAEFPIFDRLADAKNVLVAGCGGGYDVFCGLPIYFALRERGKNVHLSNLTFSHLLGLDRRDFLSEALALVGPETPQIGYYFPEKYLCQWFREAGENVPVYCLSKTGVQPMIEAYGILAERLELDAVVVVDGGTDSLMRGDEAGLGTPLEDITTLAAIAETEIPVRWLACLGFGVDAYHGICHWNYLEAVAELTKKGAFNGALSLLPEMPEYERYRAATEWVFERMPEHPSIVNASILSAVEGEYGDHHRTHRTAGSELWINPLMALYWFFDAPAVAERVLYSDRLKTTRTLSQVGSVIHDFRRHLGKIRERRMIPV